MLSSRTLLTARPPSFLTAFCVLFYPSSPKLFPFTATSSPGEADVVLSLMAFLLENQHITWVLCLQDHKRQPCEREAFLLWKGGRKGETVAHTSALCLYHTHTLSPIVKLLRGRYLIQSLVYAVTKEYMKRLTGNLSFGPRNLKPILTLLENMGLWFSLWAQ